MSDMSYVYPNQIKAWGEVAQHIEGRHQSRVLLNAEPQVGKTSFMVHASIERARLAKSLGQSYLNIIAISDANNALRTQTEMDLWLALKKVGLENEKYRFVVEHRAALKDMMLPSQGMLSVFADETHIAARSGGGRDLFQRRVYDYTDNRLLVDVGATSFAHMAMYAREDSPYDAVVKLEPGPAYNSVQRMYDQGRIRQVEKLASKTGEPTSFLRDRIATLQRHGGYTVIRATGKRHVAVMIALRTISPTLRVVEADMNTDSAYGNEHITIASIPQLLAIHPKEPTVLLLRGALRVGIVLPPKCSNNICEMVDTNPQRADTVTQSFVGRSCGYHKRNDTYGVFTNMAWIETVLDFYNDVGGAIPLGLKNSGAHRTGTYQVVPFDEAVRYIKEQGKLVSVCSENNVNNMADHVLRNVNTWDDRLCFIDKPNGNFGEAFRLLQARRPHFIGEYVAFNPNRDFYTDVTIYEEFIDWGYVNGAEDDEGEEDDE